MVLTMLKLTDAGAAAGRSLGLRTRVDGGVSGRQLVSQTDRVGSAANDGPRLGCNSNKRHFLNEALRSLWISCRAASNALPGLTKQPIDDREVYCALSETRPSLRQEKRSPDTKHGQRSRRPMSHSKARYR